MDKVRKSPVDVGKALHILVPNFFPLSDDKIAKHYKCEYHQVPDPDQKYLEFMRVMKNYATNLGDHVAPAEQGILKLLDEYKYVKYTKGGIIGS